MMKPFSIDTLKNRLKDIIDQKDKEGDNNFSNNNANAENMMKVYQSYNNKSE